MNRHWIFYPVVIVLAGLLAWFLHSIIGEIAVLKYKNEQLTSQIRYNNHYNQFSSEVHDQTEDKRNINYSRWSKINEQYIKNGYIDSSSGNVEWLRKFVEPVQSSAKQTSE